MKLYFYINQTMLLNKFILGNLIKILLICLLSVGNFFTLANAGIQPKIIGGSAAENSAWPWMSALITNDGTNLAFCGGTLIASQWVLTAAHCVFDEIPYRSGNYVQSYITDFDVIINRSQLNSDSGERIAIAEIVVHEGFDHNSLINDLALLKLSRPTSVMPIETLPDYSGLDESGHDALALGWGTTSTAARPPKSSYPKALQQVTLPIISNELCNAKLSVDVESSMLCAGLESGGRDTCSGDSGGPLIVFDNEIGTWRQAGITSFGIATCAARGYFGVYTRLDLYKEFISDRICSPVDKPVKPTLTLTVKGNFVTANWTTSPNATGYRLNYAPFPSFTPIASFEVYNGQYTITLPKNSAYFVAIDAYNGNCRSDFSNIESFEIR